MIDQLPDEQREILAFDKIPENMLDSLLNRMYKRNQMGTGGLTHKLRVKL